MCTSLEPRRTAATAASMAGLPAPTTTTRGGAGKRGRPGADEGHGAAGICRWSEGKRGAARVERVRGKALQPCDLDGLLVVAVHHARAFAQDLDRAGASAAGAQDIGVQNGA